MDAKPKKESRDKKLEELKKAQETLNKKNREIVEWLRR